MTVVGRCSHNNATRAAILDGLRLAASLSQLFAGEP
jgi:hypothetical protein